MFGRQRLLGKGRPIGPMAITAIPKFPVTVPGCNELAAFTPTNPSYTFGMHKAVDGYYYFCGMAIAILLQNRDPFFYKYDPTTNKIVQKVKLPIGIASTDSHRLATIASDASGHIYAVFEELIPAGAHGSPVRLYKTTTAGDLSTLSLLQTFTGRWTYPSIVINGSNIDIYARGSIDPTNFYRGQYWRIGRSTNSGVSFSAGVKIYQSSDEDTQVAYMWIQHDYAGNNIHIILNERNNTLQNWTGVCHIRSSFGSNTWSNQSGSFTKDVSVSALTRTELFTNCVILNSPNYSTTTVNHEGGVCKSDGSIKVLVSVQTLTGNSYVGNPETELDELRWYYWNGSAWVYENVDIPVSSIIFYWAYQRWWHVINNDTSYDEIVFIDSTANNNVYIKRSSDNFATETDKLILQGNTRYRLGSITVNSEDESDRVILITNTLGDIFEIDNEDRHDFSNLIVLFPYEFSKY